MPRSRKLQIVALIAFPLTNSHAFTHVSPYKGYRRQAWKASLVDTFPSLRTTVGLEDARRKEDRRDHRGGRWQQPSSKWPKKIISKILMRRSDQRESSPSLRMMRDHQADHAVATVPLDVSKLELHQQHAMILRNFAETTPAMVLPEIAPSNVLVDSEFYAVAITPAVEAQTKSTTAKIAATETVAPGPLPLSSSVTETSKNSTPIRQTRSTSFGVGVKALAENVLTGLVLRHAVEPPVNLIIQARPRAGLANLLLRAQFITDCKIDVKKLVLRNLQLSGGSLEICRMTLNLMSFLPLLTRIPRSRFPEQFDLHANDFVLTREDLMKSSCIRNGLKNLLVRILRELRAGASTVQITSVDVLPSGKISCKGKAKTIFGSDLDFEVRSGISTSCRGHVLTFPGLEISLNRGIGFFVPVPNLDLDVGHNTRFRRIEIDGDQREVRVSASVTITPERTVRLLDYKQSADAFAATFSTDIARWLTRVGRFSS